MRKNNILDSRCVALVCCISLLSCKQPTTYIYAQRKIDGQLMLLDSVNLKNLRDGDVFTNEHRKPVIELPEEYQAISKDSTKPDNLTGYYRNDTLFIQFK